MHPCPQHKICRLLIDPSRIRRADGGHLVYSDVLGSLEGMEESQQAKKVREDQAGCAST